MLQLGKSLLGKPVMSLRSGGQIATAIEFIINPNNLKIEGFYCQDQFSKKRLVLLSQDIRDILPQGIAVNDHDVLSEPIELVRLKSVLEISFELTGKPVVTAGKKRLGRVDDFAIEVETMFIKKLYVMPSFIKSLSSGQLGVERNQIIEITNRKIVVKDPLQHIKEHASAPATAALAP